VPDADIRTFYSELGRRVREAREAVGATQEQLAEQLRLTRASVANLEAGRQRISAYHLGVIAGALSVPLAELMPPAAQPRVRTAVRGADPQHLDLLQQLLAAADVDDMDERAHAAS